MSFEVTYFDNGVQNSVDVNETLASLPLHIRQIVTVNFHFPNDTTIYNAVSVLSRSCAFVWNTSYWIYGLGMELTYGGEVPPESVSESFENQQDHELHNELPSWGDVYAEGYIPDVDEKQWLE